MKPMAFLQGGVKMVIPVELDGHMKYAVRVDIICSNTKPFRSSRKLTTAHF